MGTNYYARIIPTKQRKEEMKESIDDNDFDKIKSLVNKTYSSPQFYYDGEDNDFFGGEIHLGKRSGGWKFLWNPNWYKKIKGHSEVMEDTSNSRSYHWVEDGFDVIKFYDLTRESTKQFIDREDVEIYDEYGEKQDKEEFWNMALNWGYDKDDEGWDGESYEKWEMEQNPNYRPSNHETEYSKFIKECGFELNKYNTDFYSDGIRFATCTDFS